MRVASNQSDKYFGGWEKDLDYGYRFKAIGVEVLTEAMEGERRFQASVEGLMWNRKERQTLKNTNSAGMISLGVRRRESAGGEHNGGQGQRVSG